MARILLLVFTAAFGLCLQAAVTTNIDMPVSFDLTPSANCSISSPIHGEGSLHLVIATNQDGKGIWHASVLNVANGAATDANGVTYRFNYHNHTSVNAATSDGQPPDTRTGANLAPPYSFTVTDTFELTRGDGGPAIRSHLVARVAVNANGTVTLQFVKIGGELGCDPI